jgi:hypothetical protein
MLSTQTLQSSIKEAANAVHARKAELSGAQGALAEAERELRLLAELAELRGVEIPAVANELHDTSSPAPNLANGAKRAPSKGRAALLDTVIEILVDAGEPMQIQALMAAVKERDVRLPGQGRQANLIAVISRDGRIVRPRRGYYGLADWGLVDSRSAHRPKRRRRPVGSK